ncbi:ABC transporter ATP-binding protein [Amycolatopsis samaneae]|uniref:ABC transporter ATP-binding protein n=1 Tax=Amycolatopsis samaneae TaxID=664691 RepID=A0ABW5GRD4_9PSEU
MELDISEVSKVYRGGKRALGGVTLRLGPGVLGLLGPNGAGKSSLMRIIATITRPSDGTVRWDGEDVVARPDRLRRVLGYLPQEFGVYPNLTAAEFLSYLAAVKGLSAQSARARIDELLELVNLTDVGKRPLGKFSGGMRQRVGIAQALLNDPELLIVDEPTAGLDPEERVRFRNLLGDLAAHRVVILSTHIVSDVEATADDIAIMAQGRLLRRGTPEHLLGMVDGYVWETMIPSAELIEFRERHVVSRAVRTPDGIRVRVLAPEPPTIDAVNVPPDLEDAYLNVVRGVNQATAARAEFTREAP